MPPSVVLTAKEVAYYLEACEAWKSVGTESGWLEEEVKEMYPGLSQADACEWAVFGYTVQGSITWEQIINEMAGYAEALRSDRETLLQIINNMYQTSKDTKQALNDINKPAQGFFGRLFNK